MRTINSTGSADQDMPVIEDDDDDVRQDEV
jgi:hypothetical protein